MNVFKATKKKKQFSKISITHRSTSNEFLWILTKTNNQSNKKIVDIIMSYRIYIHTDTQTHTHVYIPLFHTSIKVNVCFSINI